MTRIYTIGMLAVILVALTESRPAIAAEASKGTALTIHLRTERDGGLSATDVRRAVEEVKRIWGAVGVVVTFGGPSDAVRPGAAVVSLHILTAVDQQESHAALAWVIVNSDSLILPTLFVSLPRVIDLITESRPRDQTLANMPPGTFERAISRTIGRVAAHELGHYLLQTRQHAESGLMRGTFTRADLMAYWIGPFQIRKKDRATVRREVARLTEAQRLTGGARSSVSPRTPPELDSAARSPDEHDDVWRHSGEGGSRDLKTEREKAVRW